MADQAFTRRPHFDAGHSIDWCMQADPVAMVDKAAALLEAESDAQVAGTRWVPPNSPSGG